MPKKKKKTVQNDKSGSELRDYFCGSYELLIRELVCVCVCVFSLSVSGSV